MKQVSAFTSSAWTSGDYTGTRKPVMRATIQRVSMSNTPYAMLTTGDWSHHHSFSSLMFNQAGLIREFPVESIKWSRSVEADAATVEITVANVSYTPGQGGPNAADFDYPGWYTPNRGDDTFFDDWNYDANTWLNWFLPDRLVRTYEGYGSDGSADPELDTHMSPSGVWLIDSVDMSTQGTITLKGRDLGRLLLDQYAFPPATPIGIYPLWFDTFHQVANPDTKVIDGAWHSPTYLGDSNSRFAKLKDGNIAASSSTGVVRGHKGSHAVDGNPDTYWLSAGSAKNYPWEYIEFNVPNDNVAIIRINVLGGIYNGKISLRRDGKWLGHKIVPADSADDGPDMDIAMRVPFMRSFWVDEVGGTIEIPLHKVHKGIDRIRLTFRSQWNSGIGDRKYRTAVQEVKYGRATKVQKGKGTTRHGSYSDYTDIVRWLCSWAGLHLPDGAKRYTKSGAIAMSVPNDPTLPTGSVFGELNQTGTAGIARWDAQTFDQKPLMDGISAIRETTGFDFWIDEYGRVIWRLPNIWTKGNFLSNTSTGKSVRTSAMLTIDERQTLTDMSVTLSSENVRETIFIANVAGNYGASVAGYNPAPTGMRRVAMWTDQHFGSTEECLVAADLLALKQMYLYRQNKVTIAANPAIQIDDQIIIKERVTGEGYLHRVLGIDSTWDAESGKWVYQLTTAWLGKAAYTRTTFDPTRLDSRTIIYLNKLGVIS